MREYMHDTPFYNEGDHPSRSNLHSLPSDRRTTWSRALVEAFSKLISAVRFRQGGLQQADNGGHMLMMLDERIMEYTSEWCNACNMDATNHIKIKKRLFGDTATEQDHAVFRPMLNVPLASDLPLGMRLMHDTYLFIYLICTFLAVFISNLSSSPTTKQAKVRKHIRSC